jgi:hypothetical protein
MATIGEAMKRRGLVFSFDMRFVLPEPRVFELAAQSDENGETISLKYLGDLYSAGVMQEFNQRLEKGPLGFNAVEVTFLYANLPEVDGLEEENETMIPAEDRARILKEKSAVPYLEGLAAYIHAERRRILQEALWNTYKGENLTLTTTNVPGGVCFSWESRVAGAWLHIWRSETGVSENRFANSHGRLVKTTQEDSGKTFDAIPIGKTFYYTFSLRADALDVGEAGGGAPFRLYDHHTASVFLSQDDSTSPDARERSVRQEQAAASLQRRLRAENVLRTEQELAAFLEEVNAKLSAGEITEAAHRRITVEAESVYRRPSARY